MGKALTWVIGLWDAKGVKDNSRLGKRIEPKKPDQGMH